MQLTLLYNLCYNKCIPLLIDIIVTNLHRLLCCSLWMQTAVTANGVLVAKVMEGTSLFYYSLSLVADSSDYLYQFSFLSEGASTQRSVEVSFPQSQLPIGTWHSLSVVVGGGSARFYTNGVFRGSRYNLCVCAFWLTMQKLMCYCGRLQVGIAQLLTQPQIRSKQKLIRL